MNAVEKSLADSEIRRNHSVASSHFLSFWLELPPKSHRLQLSGSAPNSLCAPGPFTPRPLRIMLAIEPDSKNAKATTSAIVSRTFSKTASFLEHYQYKSRQSQTETLPRTTLSRQPHRTSSRPKRRLGASAAKRPLYFTFVASSSATTRTLLIHQLMPGRQHALMKHPANKDTTIIWSIKNNVLPLLHTPKTRMDRTARTPNLRRLRNTNETVNETVEINLRLPAAPHIGRVIDNIREIKFCQNRKPIPAQAERLPVASTLL